MLEYWLIFTLCLASATGQTCNKVVFPDPMPTPYACMIVASQISRSMPDGVFKNPVCTNELPKGIPILQSINPWQWASN